MVGKGGGMKPVILLGVCCVLSIIVGLIVYFFNLWCPFGYSCPSSSEPVATPSQTPSMTPSQTPSQQRSAVSQQPSGAPSQTPAPFLGAPQPQISGKNFTPLTTLYGDFYIEPDTSGRGSNHLYKAPSVLVSNWWKGDVSRARFSGTGVDDIGNIGNFKFIRIGSNIAKVVFVGAYDFYVYFVDSSGNPIPTPYTASSTSISKVDFGDFSSDQAGAQPDPSNPLAFMPMTYACLVDETSSGENCLLPTTYSDYTNNKASMFTYTPNPSDTSTKLRKKGFCEDGYGPNPFSPQDPKNKCTYLPALNASPAVPTAPGINPGPVPTFSPPSGTCPCGSYRQPNGQCVRITNQYLGNIQSGQPYCEDGLAVAPDGVTCYNFNAPWSTYTHPAALKC
jgi:hypothetical protein